MTVEQLVGGMVWVQGMVLMAALVFAIFDGLFALSGQRRNFLTRRRLGLTAIGAIALVPLALPALLATSYATSINATELVVSQYLKGNLSMSAGEVTSLLEMKSRWIDQLSQGSSWLALGVLMVFAAAFVGRLIYLIVNVIRIRRAIQGGQVLRRGRRLRIVLSPNVSVPFSTRGLWHYYVVLPLSFCADRDAMQMSLGHELQHIRQGDVDAEVALSLISPLVVLNPGFWFLSSRLRKLGELVCDRNYLRRRRFDPHGYSMRLLSVARRSRHAVGQPAAFGVPLVGRALPVLGRRSMLKDRILEIAADQSSPSRDTRVLSMAMSLVMIAAVLATATAVAQPKDWSHERIMLSSVANLERLNQLNTMAQRSW